MKDDEAEQRIQRAMDVLSSSPMQATSSSSPTGGAAAIGQGLSPFLLASEKNAAVAPSTSAPLCRPWDRGDLFRRLATFKSLSWFAKPTVAGPVACARRGWVNADHDLIACEVCRTRLSFSVPSNWSKEQVDKAGLAFSEKLDSGHKLACPWKGNACGEELAAFPPTPAAVLVQAYDDRLHSLASLSALPVVSPAALERIKLTREAQAKQLLSCPDDEITQSLEAAEGEAVQMLRHQYESYCQAQKLISLCGWELRNLPYAVEPGDAKSDASDCGPKVSMAADKSKDSNCVDPASVVLECVHCRASAGLWRFNMLSRSSLSLTSVLTAIQGSTKKAVEKAVEAANEVQVVEVMEEENVEGKASTSGVKEDEAPCQPTGMNLSLTIAGGPRPTRLCYTFPAAIPYPGQFESVTEETPSEPAAAGKRKRVEDEEQEEPAAHKRKTGNAAAGKGVCSSVNAVETSYQNKHENSAESVDCCPQESEDQETVLSGENNNNNNNNNGNVLQPPQELVCTPVKEALIISNTPSEFDPIHQHRYFCPWISTGYSQEGACCGWQMTIDALYSQPAAAAEPAGVPRKILVSDALASVRKVLGGKSKGKTVAAPV